MIADLKPYPEYRESGLPWLGQVPEHWELRRTKAVLREVDRRSTSGLEPLLSLRMRAGLVDHHASGGKRIPASALVGYKRVLPGEIVMNRMRAAAGLFAAAASQGLVSPDYAIFRPGDRLNVAYAIQLFRTPAMMSVFRLESRGLGTGESGFLRLYSDRFGMLAVPLPSAAEQAAIVRFLDWANGRLELAIRAKRKVIALLGEQKRAIIHRAVTRGLDPTVPLKPSGVSWLGEVPAHWEVLPFVRCTIERADYRGATPEKVDSGVFLVTAKNVRKGHIDYECSKEYVRVADYSKIMRRGLPRIGDVLLTMEAPLGHVALVDREDIAIAQRVVRFRLRASLLAPQFALYALNSAYFQNQLQERGTGSTAKGIKASKLPQLVVACPPFAEQLAILSWLAENCGPIDLTASRVNREIDLLREYRTRLVADVVTGKLDVREAAARLPVEAPPDLIEDDDTTPSDDADIADEEMIVA